MTKLKVIDTGNEYKAVPNPVKSCKNCIHCHGTLCLYSGHQRLVTRACPSWLINYCGEDFEGWAPKPPRKGIFRAIKEFFMGEK